MTAGPVGVGVIGAGVISAEYLGNLTTFPDVRVQAIADRDPARSRAQAAAFGIPAAVTVRELLARDDLEIVVNLTVPAAHTDVTLQALAAGKHVWTEKPFALDRGDARRLLAAAADAGLRVAGAPDTFLGAGLQTAQRLVDAGEIGTPLTAWTMFESPGPESWHPDPAFLFDVGAGPVLDVGPYYVTALVQLLGAVDRVTAVSSTARRTRVVGSGPRAGSEFPVRTPTFHSALLSFEGGAAAHCTFSFDAHRSRSGIVEVSGTTGTLVAPDPNRFDGASQIWRVDGGGARSARARGSRRTRGTGVLELARAIRAGVGERASGALAYHVLDVLLAIHDSARRAEPVRVESTVARPAPVEVTWDPGEATL